MSWLDQINQFIANPEELLLRAGLTLESGIALAFALLMIAILLFWILRIAKKARRMRSRYEQAANIVRAVKPDRGLENNLEAFLELFENTVEAPVYAFYVRDSRNRSQVLKAVRHNARDFGKVRPSYSGLVDYKKESYHPPLSLPSVHAGGAIELIEEGEVPMLAIALQQERGVVRIGPFKSKLSKRKRSELEELSGLIGHSLDALIDTEDVTNRAEVVIASGQAMQQITQIALNPSHTVDLMTRLCIQTMGASGGCYIEQDEEGFHVTVQVGMDNRTLSLLSRDEAALQWFDQLLADRGSRLIRHTDSTYRELPGYLTGGSMNAVAAVRAGVDSNHFLVLLFDQLTEEDGAHAAATTIRLIHDDMRTITSFQHSLSQMSGVYTGILKGLAQLLDNLSPYTIGYSELMSRYSIMIAKELGLSDSEIADVALAAYLSNIGMLGITIDLYQKEGKYTDQEFEMMKLHAEVGASIVRTTIGHERVAQYILYHHERMDGNGYPAGIKGSDIPIGSRIIGVVQTFLAKINGRKYRDPLPFHQALQTLRSSAGSQLDPQVVEAFINWFERKQKNPDFTGKSLGSCWEMGCVPSSICQSCPVYNRNDVNCWEVERNNCHAHGKTCDTCFVRTEYVNRSVHMKRA